MKNVHAKCINMEVCTVNGNYKAQPVGVSYKNVYIINKFLFRIIIDKLINRLLAFGIIRLKRRELHNLLICKTLCFSHTMFMHVKFKL